VIDRVTKEEFADWINNMPEGRNTRFARNANNLWTRFKNFENNPPWVLKEEGDIKCAILITKLVREPYCNLYEIVTKEGQEGKGYARRLYWHVMSHMFNDGVKRLKMSCTTSSIGWHYRNGIIGWGIDPTGSIRVDIPLRPTLEEQLELRNNFEDNKFEIMPEEKVAIRLLRENVSFGKKKEIQVNLSREVMGEHYRRKDLSVYYK
jgi:hypothetical protein